jgi:hypothetical protein
MARRAAASAISILRRAGGHHRERLLRVRAVRKLLGERLHQPDRLSEVGAREMIAAMRECRVGVLRRELDEAHQVQSAPFVVRRLDAREGAHLMGPGRLRIELQPSLQSLVGRRDRCPALMAARTASSAMRGSFVRFGGLHVIREGRVHVAPARGDLGDQHGVDLIGDSTAGSMTGVPDCAGLGEPSGRIAAGSTESGVAEDTPRQSERDGQKQPAAEREIENERGII